MKTLYIDNYKGFVNTYIPLKNVNFLVGENSTGKTAILNLLCAINKSQFSIDCKFNSDGIVLGYFSEMVNQNANDKSYFSIGIEREQQKKKSPIPNIDFLWLKFVKKDDIPSLSEIMFVDGELTILAVLHRQNYSYYSGQYNGENFETWVNNYSSLKADSAKTSQYDSFFKKTHLQFLISQILHEVKKGRDKEEREYFHWQDLPVGMEMTTYSPIRASGKRIYEAFNQSFSPDGSHTPLLLREIFSSKTRNEKKCNAIVKFGNDSSLYDDIDVRKLNRSKEGPFEVDIKYNNLPVKISNVGFGVSQVLPFVVDIARSRNTCFCLQQPEVHLHPKAQAAFGEFVYESTVNEKNTFFIETHSNYTIDRFRYKMHLSANESIKTSAQVLFFERTSEGLKVTPIQIESNGRYPKDMPEAYSEFFIDEELRKLEI